MVNNITSENTPLTLEILNSQLTQHMQLAMQKINAKWQAGKFITSEDISNKTESVRKIKDCILQNYRIKISSTDLKNGYTNSTYLDKLSYRKLPNHVMLPIPLSYVLRKGKYASDAILHLLNDEEPIMIIDDNIATQIAIYYALLKVLQKNLDNPSGKLIFDHFFSQNNELPITSLLIITCLDVQLGYKSKNDADDCLLFNPFHPLMNFIEKSKNAACANIIGQKQNKKRKDDSLIGNLRFICLSKDNQDSYSSFRQTVQSEQELNKNLNIQIDKSSGYQYQLEKILKLIQAPKTSIAQLETAFKIKALIATDLQNKTIERLYHPQVLSNHNKDKDKSNKEDLKAHLLVKSAGIAHNTALYKYAQKNMQESIKYFEKYYQLNYELMGMNKPNYNIQFYEDHLNPLFEKAKNIYWQHHFEIAYFYFKEYLKMSRELYYFYEHTEKHKRLVELELKIFIAYYNMGAIAVECNRKDLALDYFKIAYEMGQTLTRSDDIDHINNLIQQAIINLTKELKEAKRQSALAHVLQFQQYNRLFQPNRAACEHKTKLRDELKSIHALDLAMPDEDEIEQKRLSRSTP